MLFMRRHLLTTVLWMAVTVAGGSGGAQAAVSEGDALRPNSGWSVSRIAPKRAGSDPYCAMARRFDGGIVLTIARNIREESSIALDFQKDTLDKEKSYYVTIDPGSRQKRSFEVRPVSGRAVVIRMGRDEDFGRAFSSSGELNVVFADRKYSFLVDDILQGEKELGDCLAGFEAPPVEEKVASKPIEKSRAPETISAAPLTPEAPPSFSPPDYTKEAAPMPSAPTESVVMEEVPAPVRAVNKTELSDSGDPGARDMRQENERLRRALEEARRNYENNALRDYAGSSLSAELNEKIKMLEDENRKLKTGQGGSVSPLPLPASGTSAALSCKQEGASSVSALNDTISSLRSQSASLQKQVDEANGKVAALEQEKAQLTVKLAGNRQGSDDKQDAGLQALGAENHKLRSQIDALNGQISALQNDRAGGAATAAASLAETEGRLKTVTAENEQLKSQILSINSQIETLEKEKAEALAKAGTESSTTTMTLVAKDSEIKTLREENTRLKAQITDVYKQMAEMEQEKDSGGRHGTVATAANAPRSPDQGGPDQGGDRAIVADLEFRIETLQSENDTLKASLAASKTPAPAKAGEGGISLAQLRSVEQQLRSVQDERDSLLKQIKDYTAQAQNSAPIKGDAGDDWTLEQATLRYNEAEREIRRLGGMLEQAQAQCSSEKKQIEYKLFDPAIASQEQISLLNELEQKAGTADVRLEQQKQAYEQKTKDLMNRIDALSRQLAARGIKAPAMAESFPVTGEDSFAGIEPVSGNESPKMGMKPVHPYEAADSAGAGTLSPMPVEEMPLLQTLQKTTGGKGMPKGYTEHASGAGIPARFMPAGGLQALVEGAGISLKVPVKEVTAAAKPGFKAFNWDTGSSFGSAEQQALRDPSRFDSLVQGYLDKTKSRCKGDFAAVADENRGGGQVASYEIACVGGEGGASAAVAFFVRDGVFFAVAHEASVENMDQAMDARDSILNSMIHVKTAQR